MKPSNRTRKPCDKLKVGDFVAFPIWEFALDEEDKPGRDETWVRPVDCTYARKGQYSLLVAATFTTPAGKRLNGYLIVTTADKKVEIDAGMVLGRLGYMSIPIISPEFATKENKAWANEMRTELVRAIGQPKSKVFPLTYSLLVKIQGEKNMRHGTID